MEENKTVCCGICHKEISTEFDRQGATVYHLDCAMESTKEIRAICKAKGLAAAKAHVNKECPHA